MRTHRTLLAAGHCSTALAILALAAQAPSAQAQDPLGGPLPVPAASEPGAAPSPDGAAEPKPSPVEGVTVNAPRPGSGPAPIPADKAAAFAAEAAKNEAWKDYRKSTPQATGDPNDLSKDFPGLQAYIPQP